MEYSEMTELVARESLTAFFRRENFEFCKIKKTFLYPKLDSPQLLENCRKNPQLPLRW
jgi:hypothetical protein